MHRLIIPALALLATACFDDKDDTGAADNDQDGFVLGDDCDDEDATINPDADELCDGVDNDCDGEIDEDDATDAASWYADLDGDGFGDPDAASTACEQPSDLVDDGSDCDDEDEAINPDADELCDGEDNDCDGEIDEDDALDAATWYADLDGDGFGDPDATTSACEQPSDHVTDATDCDDEDATVNPDGVEIPNHVDDDCNGEVDDFPPEDCKNGVDDDYDGLADCEDSDCMEVCIEDCTDGADNDADTAIDCDDDECYGQDGCGGPYSLELTTSIPTMSWAGGYMIQHHFGYPFATYMATYLEVEATPDGWEGTPFVCQGEGYSQSWLYGAIPLVKGVKGVDRAFAWQPTVANYGLEWDGPCPLTGLPTAYIGVNIDTYDTLYRMDATGAWYAQYIAKDAWYNSDGHDFYAAYLRYAVQQNVVTWSGSYTYPYLFFSTRWSLTAEDAVS